MFVTMQSKVQCFFLKRGHECLNFVRYMTLPVDTKAKIKEEKYGACADFVFCTSDKHAAKRFESESWWVMPPVIQ